MGPAHALADPSIASTSRGLWALNWSSGSLMATALVQAVVVVMSGSVALFVAFLLARRAAPRRFTYGLGRVEDLPGLMIVVTIAASALVASYEAIRRLLQPQPVELLWALGFASVVGSSATTSFDVIAWASRSVHPRYAVKRSCAEELS